MVAWWTGRAQGDLRHVETGHPALAWLPAGLSVRRLCQEHGARVLVADDLAPPGDGVCGLAPGDALIGRRRGQALAVLVADCAAVALASSDGVYGAVHVGWRGLLAGVIEEAVKRAEGLGARGLVAGLGPCIGPCCYEFHGPALERLEERYGAPVRSVTASGADALDLPGAVRAALGNLEVPLVHDTWSCTGCGDDAWSYRVRSDEARQALLVWRDGDQVVSE